VFEVCCREEAAILSCFPALGLCLAVQQPHGLWLTHLAPTPPALAVLPPGRHGVRKRMRCHQSVARPAAGGELYPHADRGGCSLSFPPPLPTVLQAPALLAGLCCCTCAHVPGALICTPHPPICPICRCLLACHFAGAPKRQRHPCHK